jgi:hypothetical protein
MTDFILGVLTSIGAMFLLVAAELAARWDARRRGPQ